MLSMAKIRPGDLVVVDPTQTNRYVGVTWKVQRKLRVNVVLEDVARPQTRRLRCRPELLLLADDATTDSSTVTFIAHAHLSPGDFVVVVHPLWRGGDGVYVVLRDGGDKVRLARAGGEAGRYWNVPRGWVTRVTATVSVTTPESETP